jgi:uncharacterized protein (TIGR03089 family)
MTPEQSFADLMATQPSQPFVTYYDEASGERSELSVRSLANWLAKTHHLLGDELGLGVGDRAHLALPPHWISVPVLLGCWSAGLTLTEDAATADVAFVIPATAASAAGIPDVYAIAPDSAAVGFRGEPPAGTEDYVLAVRPQADAWAGVHPPAAGLDAAFDGVRRDEAMSRASQRAAELGLGTGGRLLSHHVWSEPVDWVDTVLAPLAVGGSVVLVRNGTDEVLARRYEQERCTARTPG